MYIPDQKKHEYWNHFVAEMYVNKAGGGNEVIGLRLQKIKKEIFEWGYFWDDIIIRHNCLERTPEQLKQED